MTEQKTYWEYDTTSQTYVEVSGEKIFAKQDTPFKVYVVDYSDTMKHELKGQFKSKSAAVKEARKLKKHFKSCYRAFGYYLMVVFQARNVFGELVEDVEYSQSLTFRSPYSR